MAERPDGRPRVRRRTRPHPADLLVVGRPGSRGRAGDARRCDLRRRERDRREEVRERREKDVDRVAFFSDAIFAIAITLLVLRITIPPAGEDLAEGLGQRSTQFLMYGISFWVIGGFWLRHHKMFRYIRDYDSRLIVMDLFLMMCVAFLPYPTDLLGTHGDDPLSIVLYSGTVFLAGFASTAIMWYAGRRGFLDDEISRERLRRWVFTGLYTQAVFLISIPLAFIDTRLAMYFWIAAVLDRPVARLVLGKQATA